MSADDDRERRLDEQLRGLTRRVAEGAPPAVPFEELTGSGAHRRPMRGPLLAAGALVAALALVLAIVVTRERQAPTVSSPVGEPIALESDGTTTLEVGTATLPAARFRLLDGRELAVLATPTELCARIGEAAAPSCNRKGESPVAYALVADGDLLVIVAAVPAGSALAVITVDGAPYSQEPVAGIVAFALPTLDTPFTIATYDAAGQPTGTVSWP